MSKTHFRVQYPAAAMGTYNQSDMATQQMHFEESFLGTRVCENMGGPSVVTVVSKRMEILPEFLFANAELGSIAYDHSRCGGSGTAQFGIAGQGLRKHS